MLNDELGILWHFAPFWFNAPSARGKKGPTNYTNYHEF